MMSITPGSNEAGSPPPPPPLRPRCAGCPLGLMPRRPRAYAVKSTVAAVIAAAIILSYCWGGSGWTIVVCLSLCLVGLAWKRPLIVSRLAVALLLACVCGYIGLVAASCF